MQPDAMTAITNVAVEGPEALKEVYACSINIVNKLIGQVITLYQERGLDTTKFGGDTHQEVKPFRTLKLHEGVLYLETDHVWQEWNNLQLILPENMGKRLCKGVTLTCVIWV